MNTNNTTPTPDIVTSGIVTPGEMKIGMLLTVFEHKSFYSENELSAFRNQYPEMVITSLKKNPDRSGIGHIYRVKAIQLPFVALEDMHVESAGKTYSVDTRLSVYMEVTEEFAKTVIK